MRVFITALLSTVLLFAQLPSAGALVLDGYIPALPVVSMETTGNSDFGWGEVEARVVNANDETHGATEKTSFVEIPTGIAAERTQRNISTRETGLRIKFSPSTSDEESNSYVTLPQIKEKVAEHCKPLAVTSFPTGNENRELEELAAIVFNFSEPMVSDSEITCDSLKKVPATISPSVEGKWRWIDRHSLVFEMSEGYFPLGTKFELSVPAGTKAISGNILKEEYKATFNTTIPQPSIQTVMPQRQLAIHFRTPIDPSTLAGKLSCFLDGKPWSVRLGTANENHEIFKDTNNNRFVIVPEPEFPDRELELDITVAPGIKTKGGTIGSKLLKQKVSLPEVNEHMGIAQPPKPPSLLPFSKESDLPPGSDLVVMFTQEIHASNEVSLVAVNPKIENLSIFRQGKALILRGDTRAETEYTITVDKGFKGVSSELENPISVVRNIRSYKPVLINPPSLNLVQRRDKPALFDIRSMNLEKIRFRVFEFDKSTTKIARMPNIRQYEDKPALLDRIISIRGTKNQIIDTSIDISKLVRDGGHRQLVVHVESLEPQIPGPGPKPRMLPNQSYTCWIQFTNLSLSVVPADAIYLCRVVDSATQCPISGVEVRILQDGPVAITDKNGFAEVETGANRLAGPIMASTPEDITLVYPTAAPVYSQPVEQFRWSTHIWDHNIEIGEKTMFWGWVKPVGDSIAQANSSLTVELIDSLSRAFTSNIVELSKNGAFQGQLSIPIDFAPGYAKAKLRYTNGGKVLSEHELPFHAGKNEHEQTQAQEPEPGRLFWNLNLGSKNNISCGEEITATLSVKTAEGAPRLDVPVNWQVRAHPVDFTPPGWEGFTFSRLRNRPRWQISESQSKLLKTKTDSRGQSKVLAKVPHIGKPSAPVHLEFFSNGMREGLTTKNQAFVTVHSVKEYPGLKVERRLYRNHQEIDVYTLVSSIDGTLFPGEDVKINVITGCKNSQVSAKSKSDSLDMQKNVVSDKSPVITKFKTAYLGPIEIVAQHVKTGLFASESLGNPIVEPWTARGWKVYTDKDLYKHSDICTVFIESPVSDAEGFILLGSGEERIRRNVLIRNGLGEVSFPVTGPQYGKFRGIVKLWTCTPDSAYRNSEPARLKVQFTVQPADSYFNFRYLSDSDTIPGGRKSRLKFVISRPDGTPAKNVEAVLTLSPARQVNLPIDKSTIFVRQQVSNEPYPSCFSTDSFPDLKSLGKGIFKGKPFIYGMNQQSDCGNSGAGFRFASSMCAEFGNVASSISPGFVSEILRTDDKGEISTEVDVPPQEGSYLLIVEAADNADISGTASFPVRVQTPVDVSVIVPESVFDSDEFDALLVIRNKMKEALDAIVKLRSKNGKPLEISRAVKVNPGKTIVKFKGLECSSREEFLLSLEGKDIEWEKVLRPTVKESMPESQFFRIGRYSGERHILGSPGNLSEMSLNVSNNLSGTLTAIVDYLCSQEPETFESRSARAMALASYMQYCGIDENSLFHDSVGTSLRKDISVINNALDNEGSWASWVADGKIISSSSHKDQINFIYGSAALLSAREVGLAPIPDGLSRTATDMSILDFYSFRKSKSIQQRQTALARYLLSRIAINDSNYSANQISDLLNNYFGVLTVSEMKPAQIAFFLMAARNIDIKADYRIELEKKFQDTTELVINQMKSNSQDFDIFEAAAVFLALCEQSKSNDKESQSQILQIMAANLENRLLECRNNMSFEQALAFRGLCQYLAKFADKAVAGRSEFSSDNTKWSEHFSSRKSKTFFKTLKSENIPENVSWRLSPGLRFGVSATEIRPVAAEISSNNGIAVKREFFAASPESKLWRDKEGVYHCKAGSRIGVKLSVVPSKEIHMVKLLDSIAGGFIFDRPVPEANGSCPYPFEDPPMWEIYHDWVQRVDIEDSNLVLYSEAMGPILYNYEYYIRAAVPGKYIIAPAVIKELSGYTLKGSSSPIKFEIHDQDQI